MLREPLLMPALRLGGDDQAHAIDQAMRWAERPWLAGFCLFGGEVEQVAALTVALRERAGRPLRIASDMERGVGQQVRGGQTHPDLGLLGLAATPGEVREIAAGVAVEAVALGVDVLFAPVLDVRSAVSNPIVGNRSLGWDAHRVAALGAAFVAGVLEGGGLPVAKHYPGHGATTEDSHDARPIVQTGLATLLARDLVPFERALSSGCPAVMTAHVAYPALDASGVIATFSRSIVDRLRAMAGGTSCVVFTDALLMTGAHAGIGEVEAARRSLEAGCDVLLIPSDAERVAAELFDVSPDRAAVLGSAASSAAQRVAGLRPASAPGAGETDCRQAVAERALVLAGVPELRTLQSRVFVVDDDSEPGRGGVLANELAAVGRDVVVVRPGDDDAVATSRAPRADDVVLVIASIRAWKGAAGVSPATRAVLTGWGLLEERADAPLCVWATPLPLGRGPHLLGAGLQVEWALAKRWSVTTS